MPATIAPSSRHFGLCGIDVYFPSTYVAQSELEIHDGVSTGKYTKGLGQINMAFLNDREDINSICLTVLASLLEKYNLEASSIGRLEIGTETLLDKSKSTKTLLMQLFGTEQVDLEGITNVNACYGGTSAFLNSIAWLESSAYDGTSYAIVIAADIAVYAPGNARATGGVSAVAMLLGPDAPLVLLPPRTTYAAHVWDFYKPDGSTEFPTVDGVHSQTCYLKALDSCYQRLVTKRQTAVSPSSPTLSRVDNMNDYVLFHSPYNKLVTKSFSRLVWNDFQRNKCDPFYAPLIPWQDTACEDTYNDRALDLVLRQLAQPLYTRMVVPSNNLSQQVGNSYTAALYCNLASWIDTQTHDLALSSPSSSPANLLMFSYGSGCMATAFLLQTRVFPSSDSTPIFTLARMKQVLNLDARLAARVEKSPEEFVTTLAARSSRLNQPSWRPSSDVTALVPGTYYLEDVSDTFQRRYERTPREAPAASASTSPCNSSEWCVIPATFSDEMTNTSTKVATAISTLTSTNVTSTPNVLLDGQKVLPSLTSIAIAATTTVVPTPTRSLGSFVSSSSPWNIVVTGTSVGLPGQPTVFSETNIDQLLRGQNCITPVTATTKAAMLAKKIVTVTKHKGSQSTPTRLTYNPVTTDRDGIQLAATLGTVALTDTYGISPSIVACMGKGSQIAVAAGLEALQAAGLVTGGNGPSAWTLDPVLAARTGIIFVSSFPALEVAVAELERFFNATSSSSSSSSISEAVAFLETAGVVLTETQQTILVAAKEAAAKITIGDDVLPEAYTFDRKFLFKVLVLANAQLAQITGATGPNMQTNAACAGTTQAIGLAQDWMQTNRCDRVVVIGGDVASEEGVMAWIGSGFRALGAATLAADVAAGARPFDLCRSGMILGAGAIGLVLEKQSSDPPCQDQMSNPVSSLALTSLSQTSSTVIVMATQYSNSAFHGAALNTTHMASELDRFLTSIEDTYGLTRLTLATRGVYFSHETGTHASTESSCAFAELTALRSAFGATAASLLLISNTKGFTGHPMGVSFEDIAAIESLKAQVVPPVSHLATVDPAFGDGWRFSKGGPVDFDYALRFAAGFGSQLAFTLYGLKKNHPASR